MREMDECGRLVRPESAQQQQQQQQQQQTLNVTVPAFPMLLCPRVRRRAAVTAHWLDMATITRSS
jgi:hypothetical protein